MKGLAGIRVTCVKIANKHNKENHSKGNRCNPEGPSDDPVPLSCTDDRIKDHPNQESHEETTNVG